MTNLSKKEMELAKKSCFGKVGHGSRLSAQFILDRMSGKDGHLLDIYECKFCSKYHIGHDWKKSASRPVKKNQYNSKNIIPKKPKKVSRKMIKKDFDEMFFLNNFSE